MDNLTIYKAVFETFPDGIVILDEFGEILFGNRQVEKIFGYHTEELIGQKINFLLPEIIDITSEKYKSDCSNLEIEKGLSVFRKDRSSFFADVSISRIVVEKDTVLYSTTIRDITDRIQYEHKLIENQKLVHGIYEASQDAVIIIDELGSITKWDSKSEVLFGWKEREVLGKNLSKTIIPERSRESHDRGIAYFRDTRESNVLNRVIDTKVLNKDGQELDVSLSITPSMINGKVHFIGFIRDISKRKMAEALIVEQEERYRILVENAPEALVVLDMETQKFVNVSNSAISLFKTTKEKILTLGPIDVSPEYQPDGSLSSVKAMEKIMEAIKGGKPSFEWTHCDSNGELILCEVHLVRLPEVNKILIRGSIQDITERKKNEQALRESEIKYRDIFENIQDVFFKTSIDGIILEISPSISQFSGYSRENMIGTNIIDIYYNPSDRVRLLSELMKEGALKDYELRAKNRENEIVYISVNARLIYSENNEPMFMDGSIRNITERKIYDFEIENQNKKLKLQNKELEQFNYVISHDLQEPLRTLLSFSSLMQEEFKGVLNDSADIYLDYIHESSSRMQELVNALLDYSRIGKERELSYVDCNQLVKETLDDMTFSIKKNGVKIVVGELPKLHAYPIELRLLFQNLISNAIKFIRKDVPTIVYISAIKDENKWIFSIKDNGIGIDEKNKDKIFIIFKRLNNRDDYEGTGIGLSHCKKIVDLHGGSIWVNSELGKGSIFNFAIPII